MNKPTSLGVELGAATRYGLDAVEFFNGGWSPEVSAQTGRIASPASYHEQAAEAA